MSDPAAKKARRSLADALFSSTQQRVLGLLFGQPDRSFFATEIIDRLGAGSGAVQRELKKLVAFRMSWQESMKALFRPRAEAIPHSRSFRQIVELVAGATPARIRFAQDAPRQQIVDVAQRRVR